MEEKHNEATANRPEGDRSIDASLLLIDLPKYINQLKNEKAWQTNDRNSITVFKTDKIRTVLVAMHEGAIMHTMRPDNVLTIQVLEGNLKLLAEEKFIEIKKQQFFAIHEQIPYTLEALEEAVFLLTVSE